MNERDKRLSLFTQRLLDLKKLREFDWVVGGALQKYE
jgi:hypothetical protein